jgi:hypothetical protein
MNREEYLQIPIVESFIKWSSSYLSQWAKRHQVKQSPRSSAFLFDIQGIEAAHQKYYWRANWTHPDSGKCIESDNAKSTALSLLSLANGLAESIDDPTRHAQWCCAVLNWGGVPKSGRLYTEDGQKAVAHHLRCHSDPGILIPENANDEVCRAHRPMSSGITKVHALLSISSIAPKDSIGLIIYDTRVAAAFNDLVARFCVDKRLAAVPLHLLFSCGSARGSQRRQPNRLSNQRYPTLSTQSPGNWIRDTLRVSWLLDAMLRHPNAAQVFSGLPPRERFLRAQMGLFMIGYDLNDSADVQQGQWIDDNENTEQSDDDLTDEPRRLKTLGLGNQAREFSYYGSVVEGVAVNMGQGSQAKFPSDLFNNLLTHFAGQEVRGGFSMTEPPLGGVGEWVQTNYPSLTPRHASFIASVLVNEGYCSHFHNRNAVMLRFPPHELEQIC